MSKLPGTIPQPGNGTLADRASCLGFYDRLRCSAPPGSRLISVRYCSNRSAVDRGDLITADDWDERVRCDGSVRVRGGRPIYRLW